LTLILNTLPERPIIGFSARMGGVNFSVKAEYP
jgi:hypothetical protein